VVSGGLAGKCYLAVEETKKANQLKNTIAVENINHWMIRKILAGCPEA